MKAKILTNDGNPLLWSRGFTPRWKMGEIGEILDNDPRQIARIYSY